MSKHYKPVSSVSAADINRANQARWSGGEATFTDSVSSRHHDTKTGDAYGDPEEIRREYQRLKKLDRKALQAEYDRSHRVNSAKGELKEVLISDLLRDKYGNRKVDAAFGDSKTHDSLSESEEREYRRLSNTSNRTSEEQRRLAELSRKKAVSEYGDSEGTEALRNGLNEFLAEEEQEPEHEM